jgi:hypothetical protein
MGGRVEWHVAIDGVQSGPFSRAEAAKRIVAAGPAKKAHVWKEGMRGWKTSDEVSVIARELSLLRPEPPPPPRAQPSPPSDTGFTDAETKKGKDIQNLHAEAGFSSEFALSRNDQTPPPVAPLPPIGARMTPVAPVVRPSLPVASVALAPPPSPQVASAMPAAFPFIMPAPPSTGGDLSTPLSVNTLPLGGDFAAPAEMKLHEGGLAELFRRQPALKYVVAVAAIIGLVILLVMVILRGETDKIPEPAQPESTEQPKIEEPKPAVAEQPAPLPEEKHAPEARSGGKHASGRTVHQVGPAPERVVKEKRPGKPAGSFGARPNPFDEAKAVSQSQITAVVRSKANQSALKSCYERALKNDNRLTSGRIDVTVSISTSGAVQRVVINAPSTFILVEPCIKSAVKRWVFPSNTEEYATNFPLIMQGGM